MLPLHWSLTFILLFSVGLCWTYGLEGCVNSYVDNNSTWCFHRNIENLSSVIDKIPENTTNVILSRNKIQAIPPDGFGRLRRLQKLTLDRNHISFLIKNQFENLKELTFLNLSCNNLTVITKEAFEGLTQLRDLSLYKNHIGEVPHDFFDALPEIKYIQLSVNKLQYLDGNHTSATLYRLDLSFNNISWFNLSGFPALGILDLSFNPLLQPMSEVVIPSHSLTELSVLGIGPEFLAGLLPESKHMLRKVSFSMSFSIHNITVCGWLQDMPRLTDVLVDLGESEFQRSTSVLLGCPPLMFLHMRNASLRDVSKLQLVQGGKHMTTFMLVKCGLERISAKTFQGLQNLRSLTLKNNDNLEIQEDAFSGLKKLKTLIIDSSGVRKPNRIWFQKLQSLNFLFMTKNKMTELTPYGFSSLNKLKSLSLSCNALKAIKYEHFSNLTSLQNLSLNLNIIFFIEDGSFKDLINLVELNLGGNRITTLNPQILHGLGNVKKLIMYNNHLHFEDWESPFIGLRSVEAIDLKYQGPLTTGLGNLGQNFFYGVESLTCLTLGFSILTTFHPNVFAPLAKLKSLNLCSISMTNTNLTSLLRHLVSLINLSLTKTDLDSLPPNLLPPNNTLKYLKVQYNHFHVLDESIFANLPGLRYLDVTGNPLSCGCQNAWFKNWSIHNTRVQVAFFYDLHCDNELTSPHLWEFDDKTCGYDLVSFSCFLSTTSLDLFLLLMGLIWHKHWALIRYLLLLFRSRFGGRRRTGEQAFPYDAFISYSSKDSPWVMTELVPRLEGPHGEGFRLCLHHRDFRLGAAILENIEMAVNSSRHTLCVVSRDFLRSEWCTLEFQLASLRLLCDRSDVLLLVFLEELPDHCLSTYTRLRKMIRQNTYLVWPENVAERDAFWVRLRDALRKGEEEEDGGFTRLLR